jgi:RND family efflux transporter MFP subunit
MDSAMTTHPGHRPPDALPGVPGVEPARAPLTRRLLPWLVLLAFAAAGAFFLLRPKPAVEAKAADADEAARVTVIVPGRVLVSNEVRVTGSIAARRELPVGVQGEGGMVTAVLVKEGDDVRAGQTLARVDRAVQLQQISQMDASIRQAQADAALAQAELDRARQLLDRGFISKADIDRKTATRDSASARVAVTRAQLGEMQARLARLDIRTPDGGIVLTRQVEPGQVVSSGSGALFRIAQDGRMEMRAQVAEQDLAKLSVGQRANVQLVGSPDVFAGTIWLIDPIIDPQARQGGVRIDLGADRRLRPGAFARGAIATGAVERPRLPQSAVQADERGSFVLIIDADNRVQRREVDVGSITEEGLAIRSGLTGDERVVAAAGAFLNVGEKVTPVVRGATRG